MPLTPAGSVGAAAWLRAYRPEGGSTGETREAAATDGEGQTAREAGRKEAEPGAPPQELSKGRLLDIYG